MNQKILQATKDILEKNLQINEIPYSEQKIVVVYDTECTLAQEIGEAYKENLQSISNSEVINIWEIDKEELKEKLLSLVKDSTVVLVQSTNFRLDDFRIRMTLHKAWVWCLEHNHLSYLKETESETYINAISYQWEEFSRLSNVFKDISDNAQTAKIVCKDGKTLEISGGFEDMKQNIWDYRWGNRGSTLPMWENFSESVDFDQVNWELSINCYPDFNFNIHFCEPFIIKINKSLITCDDPKCPPVFREFLDKIAGSEEWVVYLRELGFWLNPEISNDKPLNDVNAFERKAGFHFSMWKKHWIYRKKFHRKVTQRFHIDVFPDVDKIYYDEKLIFSDNAFVI